MWDEDDEQGKLRLEVLAPVASPGTAATPGDLGTGLTGGTAQVSDVHEHC